jgi:pyruvate dehydrogenase E1 component
MPKDIEEGIIKGIYLLKGGGKRRKKVQLMGSGTILREVEKAAELLDKDWSIDADIWSVTSYNELTREAQEIDRWNRLHPTKEQKISYIEKTLKGRRGPVISATDYNKAYSDQIRKWVPVRYEVLGTDGFGRSDTRKQLRKHFEVNSYHVAIAALKALADEGQFPAGKVQEAIEKYGINAEKINPAKA